MRNAAKSVLMSSVATPDLSPQMPGPPRTLIGWRKYALEMSRDPILYLTKVYRTYGLISAWNPANPIQVFAFGPAYNRRIFTEADVFHSDPSKDLKMPKDSSLILLRSGLLSLNGSIHRQHRLWMQPAFHRKSVNAFCSAIVGVTEQVLDTWQAGSQIDFEHEMKLLVHRIAMKTVLGLDGAHEAETLGALIERLYGSLNLWTMLFQFDLPGTGYRKMLRVGDEIAAYLRDLVQRKRNQGNSPQDVLGMMLASSDAEGRSMTEADLVAEAYTVMCHETSASALSWTMFLLLQHPTVMADLLDELEGRLRGSVPTSEQLADLPLLDCVLKESFRVLPPAAFGNRYTVQPTELGPYAIPKGATVTFSQFITHRLAELYPDPTRFIPARWLTTRPSPYEYLPFGFGAHSCIGMQFATTEIKLVIALILRRYRLSLAHGKQVDYCMRLSLSPKAGLAMIVHPQDRKIQKQDVTGSIRELVDLE